MTVVGQHGPEVLYNWHNKPIPSGTQVTIVSPATALGRAVTLYTDATGTTTASNPVTADANGAITFFAPFGTYGAVVVGVDAPVRVVGVFGSPLASDGDVLAWDAAIGEYRPTAPTGGGGAGSPVVRKFPFTFDTPNLLTGAALYTPTVGDVLLDAWIRITTGWNGTTPKGDYGPFVGNNTGMLGDTWLPCAMDASENDDGVGVGVVGSLSSLRSALVLALATQNLRVNSAATPNTLQSNQNVGNAGVGISPTVFIGPHPIKVCVSQDGTNTGADPGSTQGAAELYLVTATPV